MVTASPNRTRQFSLAEFFVFLFLVGSAVAALVKGGLAASVFLGVVFVLICALAINAAVFPRSRAIAAGFFVPLALYIGILFIAGSAELGEFGRLATSRSLRVIHAQLAKDVWISHNSGWSYPKDQPLPEEQKAELASGFMRSALSPDLKTFLVCGHLALSLSFGYCGAKYAAVIQRRR